MGMKKLGVELGLGLIITTSLLGSALPSSAKESSAEIISNSDNTTCVLQRRVGSETYEKALNGGRLASFDANSLLENNKLKEMHVNVPYYAMSNPPTFGFEFKTGTLADTMAVNEWPDGLHPQGYERIKALSITQKGDGLDKQVFFFTPEKTGEYQLDVLTRQSSVNSNYVKKFPVKVFVTTYNPDLD